VIGDRATRRRIARDIADGLPGWENILGTLGPERIEIANAAAPNEAAVGQTIEEIAARRGEDPVTTALDLMHESALDVTMILHYASDDAVRTIARHRLQLVGSDGIFGARPHPRLYGTAPRFLGRFAIREGLVSAEEAVARLTARAADRIGLVDRGRIKPGARADLVLLDPARYVDAATYADPCRVPEGVVGVWVNGVRAWQDGATTGARPGGVVR
jgi:N-acyl-D-amino-acid deacylase